MATPAERMKAHRERARQGLRRFTISVNADDLSAHHQADGTHRLEANPFPVSATTIGRIRQLSRTRFARC